MRFAAVIVALFMTLALAGCAAPATTSTPAVAPGATGVCAPFAGIDPGHPPDSLPLTPDPSLEAKFPTTIGTDPVVDVASARYIETLCVLGGQASVDAARRSLPAAIDLADIRVGSATGIADSRNVTINAFRLPAHQGAELIPVLNYLSIAVAPESPRFGGDLQPATVGGKSVSLWIDPASGATSYVYPVDDTLFVVSDVSPSQADQILAALP